MKYLLPIAAVATSLIAYAVYRSKRKVQWIPLGGQQITEGIFKLGEGEDIIFLDQSMNDEVGY